MNYQALKLGCVTSAAMLLATACATDRVRDPGAASARAALTDLRSNPTLASRAPLAMQDAETAVTAAEQPQSDPSIQAHLVYLADRRVSIAKAQAQTRFSEDQRKQLADQNAQAQLNARTREADRANVKNADLQAQTDAANRKTGDLQAQTDESQRRNEALQRELEALQAKKTDRGMVLTLGDVLFSSGRADLKAGSIANLDRLVSFLADAPDRTVRIEGHTDNVGSAVMNDSLSLRRAGSVAGYLTGRGIASARVSTFGEGFNSPVADNQTEAGRQANRRVEVIIQNPPL